ncbi:hypothetical protein TGGT1_314080 [Toxoplasma gondii GT1]|uniref:Uncharacterized protein n=8 Tax=Toxoplasma gondii TaxID=5811 RepID=S7UTH7_TOXGG|nr:hypothetical protein TGGT1_314080 [Toxoplasma gondii GT1]KAF4639547.1 hypothetical protein TGRH88_053190 [Toxoplasma gondii]KFG49907.1 hypothetical protein TGP89_314080 [Toxoplasma gondii p89]KFG56202.1 hypothetical protein TGFOU_314080 [Toxoplasma gondii FOU]KFH09950.1 hypothetical protein TGVAND_314080 [Toxoplasma gondii VAND]RQX72785.1 hypothetical protein TGCAST_314080 [Toxoplasma gondii CAST]
MQRIDEERDLSPSSFHFVTDDEDSSPSEPPGTRDSTKGKGSTPESEVPGSWRKSMRVSFQLARVMVKVGKEYTEPQLCWIAESMYSYKATRDSKTSIVTREYFGTLPFDVELQPPSDGGIYNDEEKTIVFEDVQKQQRTVRCIFPLRMWKHKVFLAAEKLDRLPYETISVHSQFLKREK